eukprot:5823297-Pleurochrysis_carterae.AAC.1
MLSCMPCSRARGAERQTGCAGLRRCAKGRGSQEARGGIHAQVHAILTKGQLGGERAAIARDRVQIARDRKRRSEME